MINSIFKYIFRLLLVWDLLLCINLCFRNDYVFGFYIPSGVLPFFRIAMRRSQNFLLLFHFKVFKEAMAFELQHARTLSLEWILMQYFITSLVTVIKKCALNSSLMKLNIKIEFPEILFFEVLAMFSGFCTTERRLVSWCVYNRSGERQLPSLRVTEVGLWCHDTNRNRSDFSFHLRERSDRLRFVNRTRPNFSFHLVERSDRFWFVSRHHSSTSANLTYWLLGTDIWRKHVYVAPNVDVLKFDCKLRCGLVDLQQ